MNNPLNISPEEWEQIEQFLRQQLPAAEQAAFQQQIDKDPLLRQKVAEVKLLGIGIGEQALKEKLATYHRQLNDSSGKQPARVLPLLKKLLAAAAILLLIGLPAWWFLLRGDKNGQLYSQYYSPDPGLMTTMSTPGDYTFDKAMVDYKSKAYDKAITAWEHLQRTNPSSDTLHYFLAAAYQANGQDEKALPLLEQLASRPTAAFFDEACWYAGLIWLKKGDSRKAGGYLERTHHTRKNELLEKIGGRE